MAPFTFETGVLTEYARLAAALDRAVRYRRSQAPEPYRDMPNLRERIVGLPQLDLIDLGDGWWMIGSVADDFAELDAGGLAVHWHPETDRVPVAPPTKVRMAPRQAPVYVDSNELPAVERERVLGDESDRQH